MNGSATHARGSCCTRLLDLSVHVGGTPLLHNVRLHMHCGEFTVIIGPNGAGKTTLFRAMLGEIPHGGELQFLSPRPGVNAPRIGYVPQKLDVDVTAPASVMDLFAAAISKWPVWLGHRRKDRALARHSLELVEAGELLDSRLGRLSGGELQRVFLALALTPVPDILLLDEPLSGVDHAGTLTFYRMVSDLRRGLDISILLSSHDLAASARVADRMVFLNRTVICDGPPDEVLADPRVRQTFGLDWDEAVLAREQREDVAVCRFEPEQEVRP